MAMLTMRARRFLQRTERNLGANETTSIGFDMSKVECYNCHRRGHFARECRSPKDTRRNVLVETQRRHVPVDTSTLKSVEAKLLVYQQNETVFEEDIKLLKLNAELRDNALVALRKKFKKAEQERDELKLKLKKFQTSSKNLSQLLASQTNDKTGLGYNNQVFNSSVFDCDEMFSSKSDVSMPASPVYDRNHDMRGDHQHYARMTHPNPQRHVVPTTVLTRTKLVPLTAARPVTTAVPHNHVTRPRPAKTVVTKPHLPPRRTINRNMSYLSDFEDINGGYVAFGGNPKGGKITGKGKTRTRKLDLDDVYFVKELKFNLFSVLQMCDKKNNVLFIDNECIVLSFDFKLPDENHVLLRVYRESNMYNVDLKNIVPLGDLTCLFAKEILDESNLWHRRLGHINFKTMNKLVKGNLVRGLPSKVFENNHTCVSCKKGKKYKASCKTKPVSSVCQPLQRFSWVFFLATKDETRPILKTFITGIKNQLSLKVKIIRSDNGTEFKNNDLNLFCKMKGIKREFSVARTPQHNGIAKRKNMTLVEAARTMLANSLLPIPFWAEVVNTACYVQNRIFVTKPHNKTPYELLLGRTPSIGFMRPFGCPVTILNTLNPLGKLDGNPDEGFLVGYYVSSKAFRVFNSGTRILQETLHINFLENKPNVAGSGPTWLFDIDTLTKSMNYQPVTAENQPNPSADPQNTDDNTTFEVKENEFEVEKPESEVHVSLSSSAKTKKHDDKTKREAKGKSPVEFAAGPSNTAVRPTLGKSSYVDPSQYLDDLNFPALEDITYSDDEEDVGAEADFTNLETTIITRCMTRMVKDQGGLTQINNEDFHTCMFACFLSQEEPKRVHQALKDPSWIEAMQEELLQFKMQKAWGKIDQTLFIKKQKGDILLVQVYVDDIVFGSTNKDLWKTLIDIEKPLLKDSDDEDVGVHTYRYLKGKPHLGLWYPKDSPFNLVAYSDSDYAGASLDRKSTIGGCQFLGCRLISWQCKKQTVVATSSTVTEYEAAASCYAQVLWIQNLIFNAVSSKLLLFGKKVIITEDTVRQALRLDDAKSIDYLPNKEIFTELARMGYEKPSTKLAFYKVLFSAQWKVEKGFSRVETPLFEGMLVPQQAADDVADVVTDDVAADDVPAADAEPTPPSPTTNITPPPP
nr:hypothetical protein [Tanacetum cinerariifolium]